MELPVRMRIPDANPLPIDSSSISQSQEPPTANSEFATVPATQPIIEAPRESVVIPFLAGPDVAAPSPSDIPTVPAAPSNESGVPMILPFGNPLVPSASPSTPTVEAPPAPTYAGQEYQNGNGLSQSNPDVPLAEPYWVDILTRSNSAENQKAIWLDYDQAIWDALAHSPYVKSTLTLPLQMQAKIAEESGIFDSTPFVDSIFKDNSDPVGNTLTTGGPNRLIELNSDNGMGVRRRNQYGGSAEVSQNILLRDNNSVFLKPHQQADTKMMLKLNQPLMRGAGSTYATASIRIAEFNAGVSQHETMRKLQLHAAEVSRVYWDLFAARSSMLQSERGMQRLVSLRDQLNARADVDVLKSQQLRAQSAVMGQAKSYARAQADMITAQANLRKLINSPSLQQSSGGIIPRTAPIDQPFVVNAGSELESALAFHPDIMANRDRLKAATTRLKVAENELRPTLNLVVESYVRGLNGDYGVSDSVADQFARGRPSATAGLNYQRPYRNIAAKAILRERRLEMQNLLYELDNTLLTVTASVEQAVAELNSSFNQLEAAVYATIAADQDVRYLDMRWRNAFGDGSQPALILDELLSAHVQLIESERSWAQAEADHMKAFTNLHLATGSLLNSVQVNLPE
ncbi:MAG: TolC family protein [Pirellulales bacterium]